MIEKRGVVLPKVVRYYVMRARVAQFVPGARGGRAALARLASEARELLTYDRDREVLRPVVKTRFFAHFAEMRVAGGGAGP